MKEICKGAEWVCFVGDAFIETNNIIIAGMIGKVSINPYGYVYTTGISTMILPVGAGEEYGYSNDWFEVLNHNPTQEEIQYSLDLWDNAFKIFEERHGYTGYIKIGKKILPQEKAFTQIQQLLNQVEKLKQNPSREKDVKGNLKRIIKILNAFSLHPLGKKSIELSKELKHLDPSDDQYNNICNSILTWIEKAKSAERIVGQAELLNESFKNGTVQSTILPYDETFEKGITAETTITDSD